MIVPGPERPAGERIVRRRAIVGGVVQGVGYRYAARAEAGRRGLAGFARNRHDGTVEVELEGPASAVAQMLDWLRRGPAGAVVDTLDVTDVAVEDDDGFTIRP